MKKFNENKKVSAPSLIDDLLAVLSKWRPESSEGAMYEKDLEEIVNMHVNSEFDHHRIAEEQIRAIIKEEILNVLTLNKDF